jgi:CHAD domain-containing protein
VEIKLASLAFERDAIARAETLAPRDIPLPVATAEDLILYKAVSWRERDRADIERLLRLHHARIDVARVRETVRVFADALGEPDRVAEMERLIARARP